MENYYVQENGSEETASFALATPFALAASFALAPSFVIETRAPLTQRYRLSSSLPNLHTVI